MVIRKSRAEIEKMRRSGLVVADTLAKLRKMVEPGITTLELDAVAEDNITKAGAIPPLRDTEDFQPQSVPRSTRRLFMESPPIVASKKVTLSRSTVGQHSTVTLVMLRSVSPSARFLQNGSDCSM